MAEGLHAECMCIQILLELDEGFNEVHPWIRTLLSKSIRIVVAGRLSDVRAAMGEIKETDWAEGSAWSSILLYDVGVKHPIHRNWGRSGIIGSGNKLFTKLPNFIAMQQCNSPSCLSLPLATRCCGVFIFFEMPNEEVEDLCGMYIGAGAMLPAQLMSCLCKAVNVLCAFVGLFADQSNVVS